METTFHNVTITIEAKTPEAAYSELCKLFHPLCQSGRLEYETDTYTTKRQLRPRPTSILFPKG